MNSRSFPVFVMGTLLSVSAAASDIAPGQLIGKTIRIRAPFRMELNNDKSEAFNLRGNSKCNIDIHRIEGNGRRLGMDYRAGTEFTITSVPHFNKPAYDPGSVPAVSVYGFSGGPPSAGYWTMTVEARAVRSKNLTLEMRCMVTKGFLVDRSFSLERLNGILNGIDAVIE